MKRKADPKPAALYVRVSSERQAGEEKVSLPEQEAACREYCAAHGLVVGEVFREVHTARDLFERPALSALREAVKARRVGAVVVYDPDRLVRDMDHLGYLLTEWQVADVAVRFVHRDPGDTDEGRMMLSFIAYAARVERRRIGERQRTARRARAQGGLLAYQGRELYGFRRVPGENRREEYPPESTVVREIYRAVADGESVHALATRLNAEGVPAPQGGRWWFSSIPPILRNPAYKGQETALRWRQEGGERKAREETEHVALPGVTPALVDPALWARANAALATSRGERTRNEARPFALRGLVRCGRCGMKLYPISHAGHTDTYRCASRMYPQGPCGAKPINAKALEEFAWAWVRRFLARPAYFLSAPRGKAAPAPRDTERLAAQLQARETRLLDALEHGRVSGADFDTRMAAIRTERAALLGEMAEEPPAGDTWEETLATAARLAKEADTTDPAVRWERLRALGVEVVAEGGARDPERRWTVGVRGVAK